MGKILVSACLLGHPVRYDGRANNQQHAGLETLIAQQRVVAFCPEVAGGLPVPRAAAEIRAGGGDAVIEGQAQVITDTGDDVTQFFILGANLALQLCREHAIRVALLTEFSPSCGSSQIYDGSFTRRKKRGDGVTAALLRRDGIEVFSQLQLDQALRRLESNRGAMHAR